MRDSRGRQVLLVEAQARTLALPLTSVRETMRPLPTQPFPSAPASVLGAAVIRGELVPVLSLSRLLSERDESCGRFVLVDLGSRRAALAVARVRGVVALPENTSSALPPLISACSELGLSQVSALDREFYLVLDASRVVPASTWEALSSLAREA